MKRILFTRIRVSRLFIANMKYKIDEPNSNPVKSIMFFIVHKMTLGKIKLPPPNSG